MSYKFILTVLATLSIGTSIFYTTKAQPVKTPPPTVVVEEAPLPQKQPPEPAIKLEQTSLTEIVVEAEPIPRVKPIEEITQKEKQPPRPIELETVIYNYPLQTDTVTYRDNLLFFTAGYSFGKSIYSKSPYGEFQLFTLPWGRTAKLYPVLQANSYILDQGRYAFSVGGGLRFDSCSYSRTFGANLFVDVMKGFCGTFSELGVGVESLSNNCGFDFRLNGYIPCGKQNNSCPVQTFLYPGNFIVTAQQREFINAGIEGEMGKALCKIACAEIYSAIGFYSYWNHNISSFSGVKARACAQLFRYLSVEVLYSYDHFYGGLVQGVVSLTLPLDFCKSRCCERECICKPRFIRREGLPLLTQTCHYTKNY